MARILKDEKLEKNNMPVLDATGAVNKGKTADTSYSGSTTPTGGGSDYYGGHSIPSKNPTGDDGTKPPSSGYVATPTTTPSKPAANYDNTVPSVFGDTTDPDLLKKYEEAMKLLEEMKGKMPTYGNQYQAQIQALYEQILGRDPFKYDQTTDPLYQQYKQDYVQQGQMAMRDTMGQAAGLTGGYGSSYSQAVGQQQYDQYLQKLADVLPETYGMALNAYNAEGDQLNQQLQTTSQLEQSEYEKYLNALNQYNTDLNRASNEAQMWWDRLKDDEKNKYNQQMDQYQMQHDKYNQLIQLMQAGYKPSKDDFNAAGISESQGMALWESLQPKEPETKYVYIKDKDKNKKKPSDDELAQGYAAGLANYLGGGINSFFKDKFGK